MVIPIRLRYLLVHYGISLVLVLAVAGVAAIGGAWIIHSDTPETTTVRERATGQVVSLTLNHSATVTGSTTLWAKGRRLHDRSFYLYTASPNLTLSPRTATADGTPIEVTTRVYLLYEARHGGTTFWTERRLLEATSGRAANGSFVTHTTLNVTALRSGRLQTVKNELGSVGDVTVSVVVESTYSTPNRDGRLSVTVPLSLAGDSYSLSGDLTAERTYTTWLTREVARSRNTPLSRSVFLWVGSGGVLLFGALVVGLLTWRTDSETLAERYRHARHAEWISEGTVPADVGEEHIPVASLTDLVDVAIDADRRVIHDEERSVYVVIDGRTVYQFGRSRGAPGSGDASRERVDSESGGPVEVDPDDRG